MKLFTSDGDYLINLKYIVMIGPVLYNETIQKYYFKIYLKTTDPSDVVITNKTKEYTENERNRLITVMKGE